MLLAVEMDLHGGRRGDRDPTGLTLDWVSSGGRLISPAKVRIVQQVFTIIKENIQRIK
jgi:hypothetical protein